MAEFGISKSIVYRYVLCRRKGYTVIITCVLMILMVVIHLNFHIYHDTNTPYVIRTWQAVYNKEAHVEFKSDFQNTSHNKNSSSGDIQNWQIGRIEDKRKNERIAHIGKLLEGPMKTPKVKKTEIQEWHNTHKQFVSLLLTKQLGGSRLVGSSNQSTCDDKCREKTVNRWYSSETFKEWRQATEKPAEITCDGKLTVYKTNCVLLQNVTVLAKKAHITNEEMVEPRKGFFSLDCSNLTSHDPNSSVKKHLSSMHWGPSLELKKRYTNQSRNTIVTDFSIATFRNEYANVFWTMIDIYDMFLTVAMFKVSPQNMSLYLLDYHPPGHLDDFWSIFGNIQRPILLNTSVEFRKLVWSFQRKYSPMLEKKLGVRLPLIKEFREYVLRSFSLPSNHTRSCEVLNVFIIWRRDYISHARNLQGKISRKISNEKELFKSLQESFPKYNITASQLDALTVRQQLEIISRTDILIGMHGAGLSYTIFQPPKSAMIELFPSYASTSNWHMGNLASRSGHAAFTWTNKDLKLDNKTKGTSVIPPNILQEKIKEAAKKIC